MAENPENVNTPHEETNHRSGKEPMGSKRSTNPQSRKTTHSRRAQPERGPSARTTRSRRTRPDVGPSTRTTRPRRTQRGNGQNPRTSDEELNRGGAQSVGEGANEMENRRLRHRLEEAQRRNAERQEKAREEQPGENETPPENQDERPDGRQSEIDEREIPHENEEDLWTQPGERRSPARNRQRSSQTHRARTRTDPNEGNTTNYSWEKRTEREEASVTSRQSRTHSRSTRRGESTQQAND
ncbi:uncharacterized protein LOC133036181 [Cannabis sativa]|uniref:uncharacterized protein LOC133036181 n=1 Tax=Cannabis sativa TaxID=3483 RepID=UPI0029C9C988|nr:uncharacterized protein LOC133036181 [Cannabis sativa]